MMDILKVYMVTRGSSDGSIKIGDIIYLSKNEELVNPTAGGWLSRDEWDRPNINDFECALCRKYYVDVHCGRETIRVK